MRRVVAALALIAALLHSAGGSAVRAATDPHLFELGPDAYPRGAVITHVHVDATAAAVDAEGLYGDKTSGQSALYQRLRFSGTLFESARLPRFQGSERALWLMATLFPSMSAAVQAFEADSNLSSCLSSPPVAMPARARTCTYRDATAPEVGMYVVSTVGSVEFIVLGFVHRATPAALARAIYDAALLAQHEAGHLLHVMAGGGVGAQIGSVKLARGFVNGRAVGVTAGFHPSDNPLHCIVDVIGAPGRTRLRVVWVAVKVGAVRNLTIGAKSYVVPAGESVVDATLSLPRRWPAGTYEVRLSLAGKSARAIRFAIR